MNILLNNYTKSICIYSKNEPTLRALNINIEHSVSKCSVQALGVGVFTLS